MQTHTTPTPTASFEVGQTYATRSPGDHDCIFEIKVVARTAKTLRTGGGKTLRIGVYGGAEFVKPMGTYSVAPIIRADKPSH